MNLLKDAPSIFRSGLERVDPAGMVRSVVCLSEDLLSIETESELHSFDLTLYDRILVLGAGKASIPMAAVLEEILDERISEGLVVGHSRSSYIFKKITHIVGSHPLPDSLSEEAGRRISELCVTADEKTLILNLVSGGGSAIAELPYCPRGDDLTLEDLRKTSELLLHSNAPIQDINVVRKHMSALKGGRMASLAYPATMVSLILSDVVGDKLDVISSGQTVPDGTTYGEAEKILLKYDLWEKLPPRAIDFFKAGVEGRIPETPELDNPVFDNVTNILIGSNLAALHAAARFAESQGYTTSILSSQLTGEAREIARVFYAIAGDLKQGRTGDGAPCCILAGGEPTVTLKGKGKGGRNQEMALAFLNLFQDQNDMKGIVFLSSATDGEDGPTDVAGGLVHDGVLSATRDLDLSPGEYLCENDSYNFLNRTKGLYYTGPTDTNICDIIVLLVEP